MKIYNKKIHLTKKACIIIAISLSIIIICFIYLKKNHYIFSEFSYTIDKENKEVTITGYRNEKDEELHSVLIIPSKICNLPVTSIGDKAFDSALITKLVLPKTVKTLGTNSFFYCTSLTEIIGLDNVESIGNSAFDSCFMLQKTSSSEDSINTVKTNSNEYDLDGITIPDSVTFMDQEAFFKNPSIKNVTMYCNLDILYGCSFSDCDSLETVNIIGTIEEIDIFTFSDNPKLTAVTISEGAKRISRHAFTNCPALQTMYLPASLEYIDPDAFTKHSDSLTIIAPSGSYAEQYAHDNSILFKASDAFE